MDIKCWGSRGSISVSGNEFLKYGGDTTCVEVQAKTKETVIIDAGTGIQKLGNSLANGNSNEYHLFFTHAHWDHILGFPFFGSLLLKEKRIIIENHIFGGKNIKTILSDLMKPPYFPITIDDFPAKIEFKNTLKNGLKIGSLTIETIALSHPGGGLGYKFTEDGKSFVFLTDNELGFDHPGRVSFNEYVNFAKNAEILLHDAEFTPDEYKDTKGWGHSAIEDVLDLAQKANVKKLGLFHINQKREDDQMDKIVQNCKKILSKNNSSIDCFAVPCLMELSI